MPRLSGAALVAAVVFAEAVLAAAVVQPRFLPLLGLVVLAAGAAALLRFPIAATVLFVVLIASVLAPRTVEAPLGPIDVRGFEAVLGGLFALAVVAPKTRSWGGAAGAFAALFLVALAAASIAAVAGGADFSDVFNWARGFGVVVLFFVVVRLFTDAPSRAKLLAAAATIGAVTGVLALAVQVGITPPWLSADALDIFVSVGSGGGGLDRIRLPGIALAYGLFWYVVIRMIRTRGWDRARWGAVLAGCSVNLLLSFNRNMWAGVIVGLAALLVLGGTGLRRPAVALGSLAVAALATVALLGVEVADEGSPVKPILDRGQVLLDPAAAGRDPSIRSRLNENAIAWRTAQDNLLLGVGPGVNYGVYYNDKISSGNYQRTPQLFLHNQYLYLVLIAGLPGLVAFVLWLGASLRAAWPARRDPEIAALAVGVLSIMLSAFVMISFADTHMLAALALLSGAIVAAGIERRELGAR